MVDNPSLIYCIEFTVSHSSVQQRSGEEGES